MIGYRTAGALLLTSLTIVAACPAYADSTGAPSPLSVEVEPSTVDIGINYAGASIVLGGNSAAADQIAIKVSSPRAASPVSKKSRVGGVLWLATDQATVEDVPAFFALYSSAPLREMLSPQDLARCELDPSFAPLLEEATVVSDASEAATVPASKAQEYLVGLRDIRVEQGLYSAREGDLAIHGTKWDATLDLPADAPPGDYEVTAYAIADKRIVSTATTTFMVEKAGAEEFLATMAHENPPVYGTLAILAAVGVGLGIGRIFGGGGH